MRCSNGVLLLDQKRLFNVTKMCARLNSLKDLRAYSSKRSGKSHYDELGVTPAATQSDIKAAYYKLSMIYHPDKSTEDDAQKKFRAITDAYEVLGNVRLKKLYDKGVLGRMRLSDPPETESEPADPKMKFYKSRDKRHVVPTMDGTTPIYDIDTWTQNHYGKLFQNKQKEQDEIKMRLNRRVVEAKAEAGSVWITGATLCILATYVLFNALGESEYDKDERKEKEKITEKIYNAISNN